MSMLANMIEDVPGLRERVENDWTDSVSSIKGLGTSDVTELTGNLILSAGGVFIFTYHPEHEIMRLGIGPNMSEANDALDNHDDIRHACEYIPANDGPRLTPIEYKLGFLILYSDVVEQIKGALKASGVFN